MLCCSIYQYTSDGQQQMTLEKSSHFFPRLEYAFSTVISQCGDASDASASVTCVARTL